MGDTAEMQKAIEMLSSVKDSIINAYEIKTGLSRAKLSHLMDAETWMDANKAVELGSVSYTHLYIAYGSNLNVGQMRMRCPHATILGTANLKGRCV